MKNEEAIKPQSLEAQHEEQVNGPSRSSSGQPGGLKVKTRLKAGDDTMHTSRLSTSGP